MQAFVAKFAQVGFARFALRRRVLGILRSAEFELEITAGGNLNCVANGIGKVTKDFAHFFGGFEIKLRLIAHSILVLHFRTGVNTHENIVRSMIASAQKMNVVRCDQAEPKFFREFRQVSVANLLLSEAVIV